MGTSLALIQSTSALCVTTLASMAIEFRVEQRLGTAYLMTILRPGVE